MSDAGEPRTPDEPNEAGGRDGAGDRAPRGDVYEWYRRGVALLESGNAAAASQLLARAAQASPSSRSVREALARAQFDTGRHDEALRNFRAVAESDPADDYAQFGWGLSAARVGDFETAVEHLALAVAMSPATEHYRAALTQARATLRARAEPAVRRHGAGGGREHNGGGQE